MSRTHTHTQTQCTQQVCWLGGRIGQGRNAARARAVAEKDAVCAYWQTHGAGSHERRNRGRFEQHHVGRGASQPTPTQPSLQADTRVMLQGGDGYWGA